MRRTLPLVLMGSLFLACAAGRSATREQRASSLSSVSAARQAGAEEVPEAATYLALAEEEATRAEALMRDGKHRDAQHMFERAEADAELALALAEEAPARAEATRARERLPSVSP